MVASADHAPRAIDIPICCARALHVRDGTDSHLRTRLVQVVFIPSKRTLLLLLDAQWS
jgi:hypothetical protein